MLAHTHTHTQIIGNNMNTITSGPRNHIHSALATTCGPQLAAGSGFGSFSYCRKGAKYHLNVMQRSTNMNHRILMSNTKCTRMTTYCHLVHLLNTKKKDFESNPNNENIINIIKIDDSFQVHWLRCRFCQFWLMISKWIAKLLESHKNSSWHSPANRSLTA